MKENEIIKSWGQVTVGQFDEMCRIQDEHPNDNVKYLVEMLYGVDDAYQLPIHEFSEVVAGLRQFANKPIAEAKLSPKASYVIDGKEYRVDITPADFSAGQYIDLTNHIQQKAPLADKLSVVVIPNGHLYNDGYDMEEAKDDIRKLPVTAGFAVLSFFGRWSAASIKTFLRCLTREMRKGKKISAEEMERLEKEVRELFKAISTLSRMC